MANTIDPADVTLAILAGGESRRMGTAKAHLRIGSRGILEYLIDELSWPGPRMLVTAPGREHPPGWDRFHREVCDAVAEGPLRGVLTAIENITTSYLVVLTVDMPAIRAEQLRWLVDQLKENNPLPLYSGGGLGWGSIAQGSDQPPPPLSPRVPGEAEQKPLGIMMRRNISGVETIEPFPLACLREASDVIQDHLAQGNRSVRSLLNRNGFAAVNAPANWPPEIWTNLNSPEDYRDFIARHGL